MPQLQHIKMSSSHSNPVIEHIVLLKAKPEADAAAVEAMVTNLNSLASIDSVLHFTAGPISHCRSQLTFTHMVHSRFASKSDLISYGPHPRHVHVAENYVRPVIDDLMIVDWVNDDLSGSPVLKEGVAEGEKDEVLRALGEKKIASIEQLSVGENFSPGRAKGFSLGSIAFFNGVKELETQQELGKEVTEFLDTVMVLDYTVAPSPVPANL
ncbi:hypothetical protein M569_10480 [Genlisea aurea]|uniref:Stress-response A/B barrel domain-containing protein n=1 Tax=Genlisea aurea TaxID=192259 RepID=S8CI21_9LAMI|nr:hypothetical protein M569_10480 [Genlisea aurea]